MATGQTIVEYNGCRIFQCHTVRFEQQEERDPSGADTMFDRFTISIVGHCHSKSLTTPGGPDTYPNFAGAGAAATYGAISRILSEPRRTFRMLLGAAVDGTGGLPLLEAQPMSSSASNITDSRDVCNGPRCTSRSIQHITANEIFRIEATFEVCLPVCDGKLPADARVLSNRWSVADAVDKDRYTSRVYSGRLRVSSGEINPNSFRKLVVPSVMPGMRLESMDFECSNDGLWLNYTIQHKEAAYSAPEPATSWEVTHTQKTALTDPIGIGEINVNLTGDRTVDRRELFALGLRIMNDRLRMGENLRSNNHHLLHISLSDYFGSEGPLRVNVSAAVRHVQAGGENGDPAFAEILIPRSKIGTPIDEAVREYITDYNSNYSRGGREGEAPPIEGPVGLAGAFSVYLQTICQNRHDIGCGDRTTLVAAGATRCTHPAVSARMLSNPIGDEPPEWTSNEHVDAMYTHYRMESKYSTNAHRISLPVASDYYSTGDTSAVIGLSPPSTTRIMRISAERIGKEPELPTPVDTYKDGENEAVLMRSVLLPAVPPRAADGKRVFTVEAEYHYAYKRAIKGTDKPRVGVNPWEKTPVYRASDALLTSYSEDTKQGVPV